jgi:hypothetical protein
MQKGDAEGRCQEGMRDIGQGRRGEGQADIRAMAMKK